MLVRSRLLGSVLVLGLATSAFAEDHLVNGNFESDNGWEVKTAVGIKDGTLWLNHAGRSDSDPTASQTLKNLKPGVDYIVSGKYKVGGDAIKHRAEVNQVLFAVEIDDTEAKRYHIPPALVGSKTVDASTWLPFAVQFKADKPEQVLRFKAEIKDLDLNIDTDNDVYLDDITITEALPKRFQMLAFSVNGDTETSTDFFMAMKKDGSDPQVYIRTPDTQYAEKQSVLQGDETFVDFDTVSLDKMFAFKVTNAANGKTAYLTAVDDPQKGVLIQIKEATGDTVPEAAKFELIAPPLTDEVGAVDKGYRSLQPVTHKDMYVRHSGLIVFAQEPVKYDQASDNGGDFDLFNKDASWSVEPLGQNNADFMNLPSGEYTATNAKGERITIIVPAEGTKMDMLAKGTVYVLTVTKLDKPGVDFGGSYNTKDRNDHSGGGGGEIKRTANGFTFGSFADGKEFTKMPD